MWSVIISGPKIFGLWWSVVVCGVQADRILHHHSGKTSNWRQACWCWRVQNLFFRFWPLAAQPRPILHSYKCRNATGGLHSWNCIERLCAFSEVVSSIICRTKRTVSVFFIFHIPHSFALFALWAYKVSTAYFTRMVYFAIILVLNMNFSRLVIVFADRRRKQCASSSRYLPGR